MVTARARLQLGDTIYDQHLRRVVVRRCMLPGVDRADAVFPADVAIDAAPGDAAALELDTGDGPETVLTGTISAIRRTAREWVVTIHSGALALARCRPVLTEDAPMADAVIRSLADAAGIDTGTIDSGPQLALYITDGRNSALDEVVRLARSYGADARFDKDNRLGVRIRLPVALPDSALGWGRDLTGAEGATWSSDGAERTIIGEGGGTANGPDRHWVTGDFFMGAVSDADATHRRRPEPLLRSPVDATLAGMAWSARQADAERPVRLHLWLAPTIQPGATVQARDLPDRIGLDQVRVTQVLHCVDAFDGAYTVLDGAAAGAGGALGGLL